MKKPKRIKVVVNKPGTAKVGGISKAQKVQSF